MKVGICSDLQHFFLFSKLERLTSSRILDRVKLEKLGFYEGLRSLREGMYFPMQLRMFCCCKIHSIMKRRPRQGIVAAVYSFCAFALLHHFCRRLVIQ